MDIARRLSTALYGATDKGTGLETADVNDQETLDKLRDDAKKQARAQIANDLKKFLKRKNHKHSPPPRRRNTYEAWIAQLHPENATVVDGVVTDVDPRFFSEGSDHRAIWNAQNPEKRVDAIVSLDDKYARLDRAATLVQRIYRGAQRGRPAAASDVLPGNFPAGRLDGHPHGAPPEAQIRRVSPAVPLRRRRASAAAAKEKISPELPSSRRTPSAGRA